VLIEHRGSVPQVHPSAYVAPTAVICGAVRIGPETRVLFGPTAATGSSMRALPEETTDHSAAAVALTGQACGHLLGGCKVS
jgi:carbonic anhydrase/acetyltransferase-like protein (isoleucine patch superfamily)